MTIEHRSRAGRFGQLALGAMLVFSLAACGGGSGGESSAGLSDPGNTPPVSNPTPPPDTNPPPSTDDPATNSAPVLDGQPALTAKAGTPYTFVPTATDAEQDELTFTVTGLPAWAAFDEATGSISGTPQDGDVGQTDDIEVTVSDGKAQDSIGPFRIEIAARDFTPPATNHAPTITGTPAPVVMATQPYIFIPVATDADNDRLTFSIANRPRWAKFDTSTGQLSGTPSRSQATTTSNIRITVSDGKVSTSLPPFSIQVQPAPNVGPVISGTPGTAATVGTAYSFKPTATDAEGDRLTWSIQNKPSWATFSTSTGQLSGTPAGSNIGNFPNIIISVSDGKVSASLGAFTIVVSAGPNAPPTISGTPPTSAQVGAAYSFTPTASDPDKNALSFSIANKPAWATFSIATGKLSGTPTSAQAGTYAGIVISVSDGNATASLPAFTLTVSGSSSSNKAPTISGRPATTATAGSAYSFTPAANDDDDDTLTFSIANKPSWATFSTSTGKLSGTPEADDAGVTSNIVISVTDGKASASLAAFSITVSDVATGSVSLAWQPPTANTDGSTLMNLAGYRIYYGTAANNLNKLMTISNVGVTSAVIENLTPGTWYFTLRAFTTDGTESANSAVGSTVVD